MSAAIKNITAADIVNPANAVRRPAKRAGDLRMLPQMRVPNHAATTVTGRAIHFRRHDAVSAAPTTPQKFSEIGFWIRAKTAEPRKPAHNNVPVAAIPRARA
jgi:hypothetical protein